MANKFININYPFKTSTEGFFLDLTTTTLDAVRVDLQYLLLTEKGERFYLPDFGTNLKKFLFEPSDEKNFTDIQNEINVTINKYLPGLLITNMEIFSDDDQRGVVLKVTFKISDGVFNSTDFIELKL